MDELLYYADFAMSVFKYYSGKINTTVKDVSIFINPASYNQDVFGITLFPNTIEIFLSNIIRLGQYDNRIKLAIIDTIIHELFHVDQIMNILSYTSDYKYKTDIETSVIALTTIYIITNEKEIKEIFNVTVDDNYKNKPSAHWPVRYIRYDIKQFYISSINRATDYILSNDITSAFDDFDTIFLTIKYKNSDKTYSYTIKYNKIYNEDLSGFNALMYNLIFKYTSYAFHMKLNPVSGTEFVIKIELQDYYIKPIM